MMRMTKTLKRTKVKTCRLKIDDDEDHASGCCLRVLWPLAAAGPRSSEERQRCASCAVLCTPKTNKRREMEISKAKATLSAGSAGSGSAERWH
jgi:hypothetical protein